MDIHSRYAPIGQFGKLYAALITTPDTAHLANLQGSPLTTKRKHHHDCIFNNTTTESFCFVCPNRWKINLDITERRRSYQRFCGTEID
jgi:hypothetical protein